MRLFPGLVVLTAVFLVASAPAASAGDVSTRVVNGSPAGAGEYPWTVAIVANGGNSPFCGGTLIASQVVLTAAHCALNFRPQDIEVITGAHDLSDETATTNGRRDVVKIALHPFADVDDDNPFAVPRRDVAALWLDAPANVAADDILALSSAANPAGPFEVSGWGAMSQGSGVTLLMQHGAIDRTPDVDCANFFPGIFSTTDMICAVRKLSDTAARDTCQGDSGGPMADGVAAPPINAVGASLVGVTSWGDGCATLIDTGSGIVASPGVYARVAASGIRPFAVSATDVPANQPLEQPYRLPGAGAAGAAAADRNVGGGIACLTSPLSDWGGSPDQIEYLIRRVSGGGLTTVSASGVYTFTAGDAGRRFICELRARRAGAGGYGLARSGSVLVNVPPPTPPTIVEVPVPQPAPPPQIIEVPQPRVEDLVAPRITSVRRSCTRRRICTFTIRATDAEPSSGLKTVHLVLTRVLERRCVRRGRRTTCTSVTNSTLRARRSGSAYVVRTRRLAKARYQLMASAVDAAGNIQPVARRVAFTIR